MAQNGNREVLQSMYDAFARGDVPSVLERFDHKVEWISQTAHPMAGPIAGLRRFSAACL